MSFFNYHIDIIDSLVIFLVDSHNIIINAARLHPLRVPLKFICKILTTKK